MATLTLEQLTSRLPPVEAHKVPMPEYGEGCEVYLAHLTADERDLRIEIGWAEQKKAVAAEKAAAAKINGSGAAEVVDVSDAGLSSWIVAACLCNEHRNFLAADLVSISKAAEALGKGDCRTVVKLYARAQEINGTSAAQQEAAEKN